MKLITNVLLKMLILFILPMPATTDDIDSWQDKIEGLLALKDFVLNETPSDLVEDDVQRSNGSISENFNLTNISEGCIGNFVDLDDYNQTVEHRFTIPEFKPEKRKHNPEIKRECQFPKRRKTTKKKLVDSFLGENTVGYSGEFRHEFQSTFLSTDNFFDSKFYDIYLKPKNTVFIEEFCSKEELRNIDSDVFLGLENRVIENFKKLEIYAKRVVAEYVEIYKHNSEGRNKLSADSYLSINKAFDPARTKGFYYLLIYSFYETGLVGVPRCMAAVEKIFTNIITYTRLMAYMHNQKIKEEMRYKKFCSSPKFLTKKSHYEQSKYSKSNFSYTDFTKALMARPFEKKNLFCKNSDLMRKEISDNIQLIINEEFGDNPAYKELCEDYNNKTLEFNRSILFARFPFKVVNHVADNHSYEDLDYNCFMYVNGYPKNILSCLMDTYTKKQIKDLADIRLKSVFILIFISKICLCNVTDLCTLPEYLILIGSMQEAYNKHKAGQETITDFQSLTSYFFSLHYLNEEQAEKRRERAKEVIQNVFPEYNEIFPNFDSEINYLRRA